ncbi:MAG: 1-acyl-sn-glycerol-3-phosphate acyltransferase [Acidimicrobiia bacterium]|nr:1-acyl-sn-glycerol-3-phosphate acyltransferase [Acidimicrobiia bacterium]
MHGIETELGRPVYGLADFLFRRVPVLGTMWSRVGGVTAHPDNAYRLLHDDRQLVLVFPEGTKGTSKPFADRYRLRRFGRGGFVEIAMRAGVPVVPVAVMGSEESMPMLWNVAPLARLIGVPYVPVTANQLVYGPVVGLFAPCRPSSGCASCRRCASTSSRTRSATRAAGSWTRRSGSGT